jgi:hypothetical protein
MRPGSARAASPTTAIFGCGVLALVAMAFVGPSVIKRLLPALAGGVKAESGDSGSDPYSRHRRAYTSDPGRFRIKAASDAADALRPRGIVDVDDRAVVDDTGSALRMVVEYSKVVPEGERGSLRGHLRQYIHPYGLVTLDSECATDFSTCPRYYELAAGADQAILAHIGEADLENVVPADGDCTKTQSDVGVHARIRLTCTFDGDVVLTFERLGLGAANLELMRREQAP